MSQELKELVEFKSQLLDVIKEVDAEIEKKQIFTQKALDSLGFNLKRQTSFLKEFVRTESIKDFSVTLLVNQINPNSIIISQVYKEEQNMFEFRLNSIDELEKLLEQLMLL